MLNSVYNDKATDSILAFQSSHPSMLERTNTLAHNETAFISDHISNRPDLQKQQQQQNEQPICQASYAPETKRYKTRSKRHRRIA